MELAFSQRILSHLQRFVSLDEHHEQYLKSKTDYSAIELTIEFFVRFELIFQLALHVIEAVDFQNSVQGIKSLIQVLLCRWFVGLLRFVKVI